MVCTICGGHTPLIERICWNCIRNQKKAAKEKRRIAWEAMTQDERFDYKIKKAGY